MLTVAIRGQAAIFRRDGQFSLNPKLQSGAIPLLIELDCQVFCVWRVVLEIPDDSDMRSVFSTKCLHDVACWNRFRPFDKVGRYSQLFLQATKG